MKKIITGCNGLIGKALCRAYRKNIKLLNRFNKYQP